MNWFYWALASAFFAGLTAILAKIGVEGVDSNVATALRTIVVLCFAWSVAYFSGFAAGASQLNGRAVFFLDTELVNRSHLRDVSQLEGAKGAQPRGAGGKSEQKLGAM